MASAIDTCRKNLNKNEAPEGFYAVLAFDIVGKGENSCNHCDYIACTDGDACSQRKRKDACEVVFLAKKG